MEDCRHLSSLLGPVSQQNTAPFALAVSPLRIAKTPFISVGRASVQCAQARGRRSSRCSGCARPLDRGSCLGGICSPHTAALCVRTPGGVCCSRSQGRCRGLPPSQRSAVKPPASARGRGRGGWGECQSTSFSTDPHVSASRAWAPQGPHPGSTPTSGGPRPRPPGLLSKAQLGSDMLRPEHLAHQPRGLARPLWMPDGTTASQPSR